MDPVVSVVLPVYNCPQYVGAAIESILSQTYADFELIVVDDGSTDQTPAVVRQYTDPRIRCVTQANEGAASAANRGIALSRGRYIARQDQDDVSSPPRIARQVAFLDAHPACGLVGTWARIWVENKATARVHAHPSDSACLKFALLFDNPFVQSSVMLRRAALDRVGVYCTDRERQPPEDFELWSRVAREYEIANLPEVLHLYREVEGSVSRRGPSPFMNHMVTLSAENVAWASGRHLSDPQVINIAALTHRARHRLQGEPDFAAMREILRAAAVRITGKAGKPFERQIERRISLFRYRLLELRHGEGWMRTIPALPQEPRTSRAMLRAARNT